MKLKISRLKQNYRAALWKWLAEGEACDLGAARKLGERAVKLGLETLDLAKMHEEAMVQLKLQHPTVRAGKGLVRRGVAFFAEAEVPVEGTHRVAVEANKHLKVMLATLTKRTIELARSNEELKGEIAQRREVEDSLRVSELTTSQLLTKSRQMQEELRHLSRRLIAAQEEERRRISRDLHDVIVQTLTGINLRLAALKSQTKKGARDLQNKIAVTQRLVEKSVEVVHRFARDLRPTLLDDLGLIPALKSYFEGFMEQSGIRVSLVAYAGLEKVRSETRTVLFRVVQEALVNAGKHSQASEVRVRFHEEGNAICLEIEDNGCGFAMEGARVGKGSKRLGLLGMKERVEMVGGSLSVESAPGKGTIIRIRILQRARNAKSLAPVKTNRKTV
jgi:signal transduction histidine kinase